MPVSECSESPPRLFVVRPSANGVQYYVDHAHERFYMIINDGIKGNFRVLSSYICSVLTCFVSLVFSMLP